MTTDNKDCSGCKYRFTRDTGGDGCGSFRSKYVRADHARVDEDDCGPSAKYYEPKEQP